MIRFWSIAAPSGEVFRLEKSGYVSKDVLARSALRLGEFEYQLEVRLEPANEQR